LVPATAAVLNIPMSQVLSATQVCAPSGTSLETMVGVVESVGELRSFTCLHINSAIEITRSWTGWHHTALVLAAEAFLSVLRYQVELLGELSTSIFFSSG